MSAAPRANRIQRRCINKEDLEAAKARLDEGRFVELSQESYQESSDGSDKNQSAASEKKNNQTPENDSNVSAANVGSGSTGVEFETLNSSVLEELRSLLSDSSSAQDNNECDGSDPNITKFLIGLVGDSESKITNPFDLADRVRREMITRAEET